ncbi:MAG: S26 family signal peptidase [Ignavibacteria bacterium]|nr:S26 family signal peptidase [Ignavibacteria bacterium]
MSYTQRISVFLHSFKTENLISFPTLQCRIPIINPQFEQSDAAHPPNAQSSLAGLRISDIIVTLIAAIVVALFLKIFILELYKIPTHSMEPNLLAGDCVVASKIEYSFGLPRYIPLPILKFHFH